MDSPRSQPYARKHYNRHGYPHRAQTSHHAGSPPAARHSSAGFADALARTIRPETFQAFQKIHGPRPISYSDWYCTKLEQFFGILLYERLRVLGIGPHGGPGPPNGPAVGGRRSYTVRRAWLVQRDAIDVPSRPGFKSVHWLDAVGQLAEAGPRGPEALEGWLARRAARRKRRRPAARTRRPTEGAREAPSKRTRRVTRHEIIDSNLAQGGVPRDQICQRLDQPPYQ